MVDIVGRFIRRFPLELGDKEPDMLALARVDDESPLPEFTIPEPDDYPELSAEEYAAAVEATQKLADEMRAKVATYAVVGLKIL